jgi:hypothetical protein
LTDAPYDGVTPSTAATPACPVHEKRSVSPLASPTYVTLLYASGSPVGLFEPEPPASVVV